MRNHGVFVVVCCMLMFSRDVIVWGDDVLVLYGCVDDIVVLTLTLSSCRGACLFSPSLLSSHVVLSQGSTPLHGVGQSGLLDLVDPLVERGAVIDAKNNVSMGPAGGPVCSTLSMPLLIPASFTPLPPPIPIPLCTHLLLISLLPACDSMRCFPRLPRPSPPSPLSSSVLPSP